MKLKRIQKELQTLDDLVSSDISILRDRIEQASWDYSAARYKRVRVISHRRTCVCADVSECVYFSEILKHFT